MSILDDVTFDNNGLVAAIAQEEKSGQILMLAYMNRETLLETLDTKKMVYWSRSRKQRWLKGETSGHFQTVKDVYIDCDGDALLFKIQQEGVACHKGYKSCFFRKHQTEQWETVLEKEEE